MDSFSSKVVYCGDLQLPEKLVWLLTFSLDIYKIFRKLPYGSAWLFSGYKTYICGLSFNKK